MSSPATVSEYGKFIDLQSYADTAPTASGSIYLKGNAGSELVRTNVGISAAGNVTAVGSFIIGSADMSEADLEKLDGITNGTVAASKAVVVDANKDASGFRNVTMTGDMTAATVTMTGFTVDADGDTALKSLLVDDSSTIGCDSDTDLMTLADGALTVAGTLSCDTSFTLDSVTLNATEVGFIDGVTAGTVAASKAVVVDSNKDAASFRNLTATGAVTAGSFVIGSANINEAELETIDGVTAGTVAASKAVVVDSNKDADGFRNVTMTGDMTAGTVTMTGFTVDADGDTALKSLLVDDSSTIGCDSDTDLMSLADGALTVNGTLSADTSFTLDAVSVNATELGYVDGVTAGTAAASKALVLDANKAIGTITHLTATYAQIDVLDVNEINSVTRTETTLEVVDKLILAASGSASAASAGGGLQIGGTSGSDTVASVLYDHANTALDFNIGGTTEMRLQDGVLRPETDNDVDLGASGAEFKDLYLDGVAYIDDLRADQLGAALDANSQAITNINVDSGVIDNTVIGGNTAAAGTFTTLVAGGNVDLGDATSDTITATGRFDSDLVPSTDSARALGTSALQWSAAHVDVGHIDQLGSALDANSQAITNINVDSGAIDGTVIGANSAVAGTFAALVGTSLSVSDGNITNVGDIALDTISADGNDFDLVMTDNRSAALQIRESSNVYMQFDTSNGSEAIFLKKELEIEQGGVVYDNKEIQFATDEFDTGASGSLKYSSADDVFVISGSAANGLSFSGSANFGTYEIQAGQAGFAATTVTSLSVSDGNITNVGSLACDSITVDAAAAGLDVRFAGNTGTNKITLTDNLASALDINEGGNSYLKFVTSNGNEGIEFSKEAEFKAGGIVGDDQAMVFGDDDDGSIAFISAANVVRFDGGSAGLHFNDTSAFGADGSGKDVSFHGAAANELMKYTAADHTLKFVNGSSATILTLGGDATSEFAVDVADGSNNVNKIRAAAFVTYSDERLKTDVSPIQGGLDTVNNLKAVNFTWKKDGSRDFGFMAQQLKQVVPQAVHGTEEGLYGVDYGRLSAILVSAIQEQSAQIASLKKQLENK